MGWLGTAVFAIIIGLIAGAVARLVVPGKQDMSIPMTILLGIIGSLVGGFLGKLIFNKDANEGFFQLSGLIGSIIGAIIVVFIWSRFSGRRSVT
ncbi:GlsB/YeaQ/YmgE family stress response membrane protein [Nakamurella aerolata]|uniref:GlsB/YeaQ/YmgE family stress response membrane protein n=1 Tax=Nakamurella aerolata TaxID=1656892 RepID=A0A849ACZ2_9ACTN|nr:GlsB/YeaQ/YmgE family stress response membrane protein [Nakamurella aerolata]